MKAEEKSEVKCEDDVRWTKSDAKWLGCEKRCANEARDLHGKERETNQGSRHLGVHRAERERRAWNEQVQHDQGKRLLLTRFLVFFMS